MNGVISQNPQTQRPTRRKTATSATVPEQDCQPPGKRYHLYYRQCGWSASGWPLRRRSSSFRCLRSAWTRPLRCGVSLPDCPERGWVRGWAQPPQPTGADTPGTPASFYPPTEPVAWVAGSATARASLLYPSRRDRWRHTVPPATSIPTSPQSTTCPLCLPFPCPMGFHHPVFACNCCRRSTTTATTIDTQLLQQLLFSRVIDVNRATANGRYDHTRLAMALGR